MRFACDVSRMRLQKYKMADSWQISNKYFDNQENVWNTLYYVYWMLIFITFFLVNALQHDTEE